jgi:hypothetical protein
VRPEPDRSLPVRRAKPKDRKHPGARVPTRGPEPDRSLPVRRAKLKDRKHPGARVPTREPLVVIMILAVTAIGACTLFEDGPPDNTCTVDQDCFRAQGEHCDQGSHTCIVVDAGVDAGVDTP